MYIANIIFQGKGRDYRGLTNLRFSFARHQQSLLITHFPVKFIIAKQSERSGAEHLCYIVRNLPYHGI